MSNQPDEQKTIPIGVVLIVVGLIVVVTAAAVWLVLPKATAMVAAEPRATLPTTAVSEEDPSVALLPETPIDEGELLPDHFVSLEDALKEPVTGQPEFISIPSLGLEAPVEDVGLSAVRSNGQTYYQWQVPSSFKAGWHNTSAPLGVVGNTVLNGHHNVYGEVFGQIVNLQEGDEIIVSDKDVEHHYAVSEVQILPERDQPIVVRNANAKWIQPTDDERITLVTCWPEDDNSHRVVVVAFPIDDKDS